MFNFINVLLVHHNCKLRYNPTESNKDLSEPRRDLIRRIVRPRFL
jgi:hypothetical protein